MPASVNLCARDDVKTYLGLGGTTHDDLIEALIPAASETIENACGRVFGEVEVAEERDGDGQDRIVLRRRPVLAVSGVWDDPDRVFGPAAKLAPSEWVADLARGILRLRRGAFRRGTLNVRVDYTAGYEEPPADAAQACVVLVAAWFRRGREGADGLTDRTSGGLTQRFAGEALPPAVEAVVRRYREHAL